MQTGTMVRGLREHLHYLLALHQIFEAQGKMFRYLFRVRSSVSGPFATPCNHTAFLSWAGNPGILHRSVPPSLVAPSPHSPNMKIKIKCDEFFLKPQRQAAGWKATKLCLG